MKVRLCSIPFIDSSYDNVLSFNGDEGCAKFLEGKTLFTLEINNKDDAIRDMITVKKTINELHQIDYLYYHYDNKRYCYFVERKEYVTSSTTNLYLTLDVWTTYYFNYTLLESFIDRCHLPRWVNNYPTYHMLDDELASGELEMSGRPIDIATFNDSVVIASSVPLGKVPNVNPGGGGGGGGSAN